MNEANVKFNKPSGNIILQIASKYFKPVSITCKYIVNNTGLNSVSFIIERLPIKEFTSFEVY